MPVSSKTQHRPSLASARLMVVALAFALPHLALAQSAPPLALAEALRLALTESPRLAAQGHAVEAARAAVGPAGQLPDPKLVLGVDNLPVEGPDRYSLTRDFMTMRRLGVMQDFPRAEKRRLQTERAQAEADKAGASLAALSASVRGEVAVAWLDAYAAQAQLRILGELVPEAALLHDAAQAQFAGGKGAATDVIAAKSAEVAVQDRLSEARRDAARARAALARWIGPAADRPLAPPPDLTTLALPPERLLAGLEHHPELSPYGPQEALAKADVGLAEAASKPDWSLEVAYQQRGEAYANMLSVAVRIDLPLWAGQRQEPLVLARQQQLEQVRAEREDARRMHEAALRAEIAAWESARERLARLTGELLPLARARSTAALAAYRGGRGPLDAVLAARTNEIETRLMEVRQQAELGRAWAALNFLLESHPQDKS